MSVRSVWGVVLIVVGVIGVLAGLNQLAEVSQLDKLVGDFSRQFGGGQSFEPYAQAARDAKIGGLVKIVGGILLAIAGTWLINDARDEEREGRQQFLSRADDSQDDREWKTGEQKTDDKWRF